MILFVTISHTQYNVYINGAQPFYGKRHRGTLHTLNVFTVTIMKCRICTL